MKAFLLYLIACLAACLTGPVAVAQTVEPWYNVNHVNADKPGAEYRFSFVHLTDTHIGEGYGDYGTAGLLDEPPAGDVGYSAERLRRFVDWVNAHRTSEDIHFVVVSGDLTDSGERSEFLKFKEIMDVLEVPYVPLIGNHDVWPYNNDSIGNRPNGDSLINTLFADVFEELQVFFDGWDDGSRLDRRWNLEAERNNYLQNFRAFYRGFHFLFLDFNPRYPAPFDEPGIGPEAQIMDFDGGTWDWVRQTLPGLDYLGDQNVFLISHHPPIPEIWSFVNAFSLEEKATMMDFLFPFKAHLALWLAGHIHRNKVYPVKTVSWQPFNVVVCAETEANKEIDQGAFRIIRAYESSVPTSVQEQQLLNGLDIYPNPGDGLFNIFLKDNHDKALQASVFDNTGRLVGRHTLIMEGYSYQFALDLRGLPTGMYYVRLENSERSVSARLVIR